MTYIIIIPKSNHRFNYLRYYLEFNNGRIITKKWFIFKDGNCDMLNINNLAFDSEDVILTFALLSEGPDKLIITNANYQEIYNILYSYIIPENIKIIYEYNYSEALRYTLIDVRTYQDIFKYFSQHEIIGNLKIYKYPNHLSIKLNYCNDNRLKEKYNINNKNLYLITVI